jgi:hypothetical protein
MAKRTHRVWARPNRGEKALATTGNGQQYVIDGTSGTWRRTTTSCDRIEAFLRAEFQRCGFSPRHLKVREVRGQFQKPEERGAFYVNLGYLRGLDPDELFRLLISTVEKKGKTVRRFPDNCGQRRVLEAISRLQQRVEIPPMPMVGDGGPIAPFSEVRAGLATNGEEPTPEQTGNT